ncbi:hypothetical protein WOLCODRAFT_140356 [Wolfiporia cocos MD-104 SS10]|uniref:Uncharacterized protein n=1 Tax=Wolfiporia cocos (strain MD-104) TaxID=742152 RepID=A0A2H3JK10_WOLCO|nr:hypothetical protein WOLCODRAFT_140356 [Wolfiporia cocos MD-104 SS10]
MSHADGEYTPRSSRFLSSGSSSGRRSPSRQSHRNAPRSTGTLRGSSLSQTLDDDGANGRHSLAHELAVALMPEPSAGSKLLAEEFGIEYDEGAEGIDESPERDSGAVDGALQGEHPDLDGETSSPYDDEDALLDVDPAFGSAPESPKPRKQLEQDPMIVLAQNLEYTEKFLAQLRRLDADHGGPAAQANLESLASDMIRRINDSARDREGQVRELLEYEREFRKIAGEVNGTEVLGQLDALPDLIDDSSREGMQAELDAINEEEPELENEWEVDPDAAPLAEDEEYDSAYPRSPDKTAFPDPPPPSGPPTAANTIMQLSYLRTYTSSAAASLAVISEHTQVSAAATTEAGRKIRALKNKLGGWRTDWDSAERSRVKIERWEAGLDLDAAGPSPSMTPRLQTTRRIDGRKIVQEHLQAFEKALTEANMKTQAIMASAA